MVKNKMSFFMVHCV